MISCSSSGSRQLPQSINREKRGEREKAKIAHKEEKNGRKESAPSSVSLVGNGRLE
jgi:hypothetical protein